MPAPIVFRTREKNYVNKVCPYCKRSHVELYTDVTQKRFGPRTIYAMYCRFCKMRIDATPKK